MRMISADDLLMLIDDHDNMVLKNVNSSCLKDVYKMAHVHIKDLIKMMPIIEQKTGIWIRSERGYTCNQCGKTHLLRTAYCPSCGAEMDF